MSRSLRRIAARWFTRAQHDKADKTDQEALKEWTSADPKHAEAFAKVTETLDDFRVHGPRYRDAIEAGRPRRDLGRAAFVGSGLALAAAAAFGFYWMAEQAPERFTTAIGEQRTISLRDGSVAELNTNTKVNVARGAERRHVGLERGEALFAVAHDAHRPFEVRAGHLVVRAVGTAFVVRVEGDIVRLAVIEGEVSVRRAGEGAHTARSLSSGAYFSEVAGEPAIIRAVDEEELTRRLAWRAGMLHFTREPLREAVLEVSRYTGARFEIADPAAGALSVSAYYRASNLEGFLAILEHDFPELDIERGDGVVRIARRREAP